MDAIADQEANLISMTSLQEGAEFEKDINNIIGIISNVEKNMNHQKLTNQFKKNTDISFNRRKLEMTRTIMSQNNHQQLFMKKRNQMNYLETSMHARQKGLKSPREAVSNTFTNSS